jgi:hypothetical protein
MAGLTASSALAQTTGDAAGGDGGATPEEAATEQAAPDPGVPDAGEVDQGTADATPPEAADGGGEAKDADEEPPPRPLMPRLRVSFKDAAQLRAALSDNAWAQELMQSNLYRGLAMEFAPALFALGNNFNDAWKGRLVDFLLSEVLDDHPVEVQHYAKAGLVSPLAFTVRGLGSGEKAVLGKLVSALGGPEVDNGAGVKVTPVRMNALRFASILIGDCFVLSRDPVVAGAAAETCKHVPAADADGFVAVDLDDAFPQVYTFVHKFLGIEDQLLVAMQFDSGSKRFVAKQATIGVGQGQALHDGELPAELAQAIPAEATLVATVQTPAPTALEPTAIKDFLKQDRAKLDGGEHMPVTFLYLGSAGTAVMFPWKDLSDKTFADLNALFSQKGSYELRHDKVCGKFVVVAPQIEAIEAVRKACAKQTPAFADRSPEIAKTFQGRLAAGLYADVGGLLASALFYGAEHDDDPNASLSPEVTGSMDLLRKLPAYAFVGNVKDGKLVMDGVSR